MTDLLDATPRARTLDEPELRRLFPDAPRDLAVPRDVRALFTVRMRSLGGEHRRVLLLGWGGALAVAAALALSGNAAGAVVLAGLAIAVAIGVAAWQHSSAADDFFDRYAAARGLHHREGGAVHADVPLFGKGDEREWPRVLEGNVFGQRASLAHYTYTTVGTDSEGNRTETDHDYTVLRMQLPEQVAARYVGVSLSPRGMSLGALQDRLASDRAVRLESTQFAQRYSLRVVDEQDDIALFELFSPPFVQLLATDLRISWEQRRGDIVFWREGHESEAADLDAMCRDASCVLARYLEEWR